MSVLKIPVRPGIPLFDVRVLLDGSEYLLRFDWHGREARWYFDVLTPAGDVITSGIKIISNYPLYSRETAPNSPPGDFMCHDFEGLPPRLEDFGQRSLFLYLPRGST